MKKVLCAATLLLAMASFASAGVICETPVVDSCCPSCYPTPVYTYSAPTVYVQQMPVVVDGVVNPVYPTTVVPATGVYTYPSYIVPPTYVIPRMPIRRMGVNRIW